MPKSLNRVQLIGNLTRDPELRYTPSGAAVCSFGIATNRTWTTDTGEKREEVDFHNIVAWRKLAEICSQYLAKGRKAYVEGRLTTRSWTGKDGQQKTRTEVVIDDMIILDNKSTTGVSSEGAQIQKTQKETKRQRAEKDSVEEENASAEKNDTAEKVEEEVSPEDIPF